MHQQGDAGLRSHLEHPDWPAWKSMLATGEGAQKGAAWARKAVWGNVPDDLKAKFGSVDNITSSQFMAMWDAKLHHGTYSAPAPTNVNFASLVKPSDINPPGPGPSEAEVMAANQKAADYAADHSLVTEAFQQSNLTTRAVEMFQGHGFNADPDFQLTPAVQAQLQKQYGLSDDSMSQLGSAVSLPHAQYLAQQAADQQQREQFIASYGLTGVAAVLTAGMLDPVAIAAGAASGGLADAVAEFANLGRAGRIVLQAIAGAGTNVGLAYGMSATGDQNATRDLGVSAAMGALFGSAYGLISRNPATIEDALRLRKAGQTLARSLEDNTAINAPERSMGAAANPNADIPFLNDKSLKTIQGYQVPYTYNKLFGVIPVRFSAAGVVKSSKSAMYRLMGGIGLDGVGWADHSVNDFSPAEEAELLLRQHQMRLHEVWEPAAEEYAKDQGYKVLGVARAGSDFNEQVYRYVVNKDVTAEFHEAVARVGNRIRELNADILAMAKNPGERQGLVSRAVQGFADVPPNKHYMMRVYAAEKVNAMRETYGDEGLMAWTRGAIRKAQPDLSDEEIDKLAEWHVKRIAQHANGVDEKLNLALSGFDREQLKEVFHEAGLDDERIDSLLNSVKRDSKTGADSRAKHRLLLDENYVLRGYQKRMGGTGDLALSDLTVTDASLLSHIYFKHMFGRIALANWKLRNPETGELLVNGVTSDNEWKSLLKRAADYAMDNLPKMDAAKEIEKNTANLNYMYNSILGRLDPDAVGAAAQWLRRFGDINYIRLGGNFGFAQLPEMVAPIAHLGVKAALSTMPAFRRFVTQAGDKVLKDEVARDVEAMWGLGADEFRGFQYFRHEETGAINPSNAKIDNALSYGKSFVSKASGLHVINAALQRWTGKAILSKFAELARKSVDGTTGAVKLDALNPSLLKRMRYLGLSDDMLKRVLKEVRDNFELQPGMLFGHKVTRLNLAQWSDQEARAAFENAGFRWARNIVQENDIGTMHRWMSKPLARALMQFRVFPLVAWDKQFLHNIHMRDMTSFNVMWMSMVSGAMTYALQTQIQSLGRSDADKFLEKRLTLQNLALGGFQRAGWSSLLPTMWDTGAYVVGGSPMFDFRTSGQPTDAIFGNPTMSMLDDLSKASKGMIQPWMQGRERSQQEYRNIARIAPLATWLPWTQLLSTMVSDKPLYAPKGNK